MMSMWESMGGAGLGLSGATGKQGLRGGRPHLLELVHSLLQLDSHCVLLFPSDRRGEGGENRPGVPPATSAPAPHPLRPRSDPRSSSLDGNSWRREYMGCQPVGSCSCWVAPYFLARAELTNCLARSSGPCTRNYI